MHEMHFASFASPTSYKFTHKTLDVAKTFTKKKQKKKKKDNRVLVAPIAASYHTTPRYYVRYVITSYE